MDMKRIFVAVAAALLTLAANAQGAAFSFASFDMDARSAALAGTGKDSSGNIAWTAGANPAAMVFSDKMVGVQAGYGSWMPASSPNSRMSAAAAYNSGKFGIGVSYSGIFHPAYEVVGESGELGGTFAPSDMKLAVGAGFRLPWNMSVGVVAKYLESSLAAKQSYNGFSGSLYLGYSSGKLGVSLGIEDLGPAVKGISGQKYSLPSSVLLSGNYSFEFSDLHSLQADLDLNYYLSNAMAAALGVEYSFKDMAFVRAGYRVASRTAPAPGFLSCGLGVKLWGVGLDAAYIAPVAGSPLGNSMLVSLSYSF